MGKLTRPRRTLHIARNRLADLIETERKAPDGRRHETTGIDIIGALGPDVVTFGTSSGRLFGFEVHFEPHLILSGKSGSGKTKTEQMFIAGLSNRGDILYGIDPKGADFEILRQLGVMATACTIDGSIDLLDFLMDEMERRAQAVADYINVAAGRYVEKYYEIPGADPDIWLFFEETAALLGKGSGLNPQQRQEVFGRIWDLTQRGRSLGIHMVFVVQMGTLISFGGDNGNGIRSSAAARIAHDRNPDNLKAMFDSSEPATEQVVKRVEAGSYGRVAYSYLDARNGAAVRSGQVALLELPQFVRVLRNYSGPGPKETKFDKDPRKGRL